MQQRVFLIRALFIFMTSTTPVRLLRTDMRRSSTVSTTEDHVLKGHTLHKQRTRDFLSCAQLCLAHPSCASFNYENIRNGVCELNREMSHANNALCAQRGYYFGQLVNISEPGFQAGGEGNDHKYTFTTLGAQGETGPSDTSGYVGTSLEGKVKLNNGIQIWTVPVTGSYVIEATGGSGANGTYQSSPQAPVLWRLGGSGAKIRGTFQLKQGTQLKILVGQEGVRSSSFPDRPGGGGGGSFVTLSDNTPLIIAGGGGGGGSARDQFTDGDPGQATKNGTQLCGGTGGTGGQVCNADTGNADISLMAVGGAGLSGDGKGWMGFGTVPLSFINGGTGGTCQASHGGFGGGAFALVLGGGGGGYSGGGVTGTSTKGTAGGGGSYNNGTNQHNMAGVNKGDGKVTITLKT